MRSQPKEPEHRERDLQNQDYLEPTAGVPLMLRFWVGPTPVFLPGESHGSRSLVGFSPQGRKESDTTDVT